MEIFRNIVSENSLVFDVGCNIGDKSESFLKLGAKVVGFEPQVECFEYCKRRFVSVTNFDIENIALDDRQGLAEIHIATYHTISSMSKTFMNESKKERFSEFDWPTSRLVPTDTLDAMIKKWGIPQFIKIDVEGYELNVLKGLSQKIDCISIEFNPELKDNTILCIEYIHSLNSGNTLFNYCYRNDDFLKFDWLEYEQIIDYIKSVNDFKFEFGDIYCKSMVL